MLKLVLSIRNRNKNVAGLGLIQKHYKKLVLYESNKIQKIYFYLVLTFSTMIFFNCDKPKEISPDEFQTLIRKSSDLHVVTYLGIEEEKAILKVSTRPSIDSKKWKDEYFYARKTPDLDLWIDENIYGITTSNFTKLYSYILSLDHKEFQFGKWTILTRDHLRTKEEKINIEIIYKDKFTAFNFQLYNSKVGYAAMSMVFDPSRDVEYKKLWRELVSHIQQER
nr:hypothetical protein [Leptospira weilii]